MCCGYHPFKFLGCKQVSTFLLNLVKMWLDHKSELICLGQLPTGVNIFFVQFQWLLKFLQK